jgi:hypothetical protein
MNEKGQAFTLYKMLISVIFVFLVLVIIITSISYFENLRLDVSKQRVFKAMEQAVKQPNGDVLKVEKVSLGAGTIFTARLLGDVSGADAECLTFDAIAHPAINLRSTSVATEEALSVPVYIRCTAERSECYLGCEVCCTFSVGKDISPAT